MSFELIEKHGDHEVVLFCRNKEVGLKAIIAVHSTSLGPALGGTRMMNYKSDEEALVDVLRLSRGMTYKAAAAGLNLGGGKAVIIGDNKKDKTEALFRAFGTFVNSLQGQYITAEDVGTNVNDMEYVFMETPYVTGISKAFGGSGDPSPYTARGVLMGIKASVKERLKTDRLNGLRVAVQGLGNVGSHLVRFLVEEGVNVIVADIDKEKLKSICDRYSVTNCDPDKILETECDVLAPCALGAVINDDTIGKLKCSIVAGGANNQLAEDRHGKALKDLGILYAPDYVINSGGLMNVFVELEGYSQERALGKTSQVYDNLIKVFKVSERENISTQKAADKVAEERIRSVGDLRRSNKGIATRSFSTLREITTREL